VRAALPLLLLIAGCDNRPRQWDAVIYPDENDLTTYEEVKGFRSFEYCRDASLYILKQKNPQGGGTFECGYMCRYDTDMEINVCKETRD